MTEKPEHRQLSSTGSYSYKLQVVSELEYGNEERQSNSTAAEKTNTTCISKVASHSNISDTSTSDGNQTPTPAADSGLSSNSQRLQILTYEVSQYGTSIFGYTSTSPPLRHFCPEGQYEINGSIHE